jgi:raffinose/stachyose/melibiose transport system substrate-binding protein
MPGSTSAVRSIRIRQRSWSPRVRLAGIAVVGAMFALGVGASEARPAGGDQVTLNMLFNGTYEPAWSVLIKNFEHAYPNITVNIRYGSSAAVGQEEATELAAGTAPDLLFVTSGCGGPLSVCVLARAGDLAPMIKVPWAKRSLPLVTSVEKLNGALYAFEPVFSPYGIFTNDGLFEKLGLKVPQTFSQLLAVCQKAQADGTWAMDISGESPTSVGFTILGLATPLVFGQGTRWTAALKAGTVSFEGTAGWRQALQEFVDMNKAGCFEPGAAGNDGLRLFAQGQGLMMESASSHKGDIDTGSPQFSYSFHPFPAPTAPGQPLAFLELNPALGVNAHSSAQNQAAAETFVDFVARPKQDALYARITGGLTQSEFLKGQIPAFMSDFAPIFHDDEYVVQPLIALANPNVWEAVLTDGIGLVTGQETPDSILQAMDAAWKQGPA